MLYSEHYGELKALRLCQYPLGVIGDMLALVQDGLHGIRRYVPEGVPLLGVGNVTDEEIKLDEVNRITAEEHERLAASHVRRGDLLVTITGRLGTASIYESDAPANLSAHVALCRPKARHELLYLKHYLASRFGAASLTTAQIGSTHPHINVRRLVQLPIPLPPHRVQRELAAAMNAARAERRAKLAKADVLLAGLDGFLLATLGLTPPPKDDRKVFAVRSSETKGTRFDPHFFKPSLTKTELVLNEWRGDIVELASLLQVPPINGADARAYQTAGRRYLRVQNVKPFEIVMKDIVYVSGETKKDILLQSGDVLLTRKGTFGVAAKVSDEETDCLISSEIILLRRAANAPCSADFFVAWLNSSIMQTILTRRKTGAIMGHITQDVVAALRIPIPEPAVQETIATEARRRRESARRLRAEAEAGWQAAKRWFEEQLLGAVK